MPRRCGGLAPPSLVGWRRSLDRNMASPIPERLTPAAVSSVDLDVHSFVLDAAAAIYNLQGSKSLWRLDNMRFRGSSSTTAFHPLQWRWTRRGREVPPLCSLVATLSSAIHHLQMWLWRLLLATHAATACARAARPPPSCGAYLVGPRMYGATLRGTARPGLHRRVVHAGPRHRAPNVWVMSGAVAFPRCTAAAWRMMWWLRAQIIWH